MERLQKERKKEAEAAAEPPPSQIGTQSAQIDTVEANTQIAPTEVMTASSSTTATTTHASAVSSTTSTTSTTTTTTAPTSTAELHLSTTEKSIKDLQTEIATLSMRMEKKVKKKLYTNKCKLNYYFQISINFKQ